ncbi:MAG: type II toxin-antitoxin system VapC family toxin [Gammaproteobacteria bacterium]|nr:type II toxin-antitoxin system VapC family toxin [Gammaproteobacteria bacterium]
MSTRYLIDTHYWLWWNAAPERLSETAREVIGNGDNEILFSVVSAWEVTIKHALGKLRLPLEPLKYIPSRLQSNRMGTLPIHLEHTLRVGLLPPHHRDPFDRMLIAQARAEQLTMITADEQIRQYEVPVL